MKFSYQWLAELLGGFAEFDGQHLARQITMKTAECEGVYSFGAHFGQVLIVRVQNVQGKRVLIDAGPRGEVQVVCGAANVRAGMLTAWVPPGTLLNDKLIGVAAFDGIESQGMLASVAELELGRDHSGIMDLSKGHPGQLLAEVYGLKPDWIIEIDNKSLTHRPDLWGHVGMAREVAAITGKPLNSERADSLPAAEGENPFRVRIEATELCNRFSALAVDEVIVAPSSFSLAARLQAVGINPISNIVDITNFLLAQLPQPMHAYDADKLTGKTIYVRKARDGERLLALNGEEYKLDRRDLVIADESGPVGLAGVIGGAATAIDAGTKRILLEAANFDPASVRLSSVRHRLRTDASVRFEKSLDPETTIPALERAFAMLRDVCPEARVRGGIVDERVDRPAAAPIELSVSYVARKLGTAVSAHQIEAILSSLGFGLTRLDETAFTVTVPSWRATKDISGKADLVEEIGRMIGYGEITPQAPAIAATAPPSSPMRLYLRRVRTQLADQGFTEIFSYSFVSEADAARFGIQPASLLAVQNPIAAELSHMRPSLLPGVFKSLLLNARNPGREFRLFEIGNEIHVRGGNELPDEVPHGVALLYAEGGDQADFFELKRVLECVLPEARLAAEPEPEAYEHPVRAARVSWHGEPVGGLFELHPQLLEAEGIEGRAFLFDLDLRRCEHVHRSLVKSYTPPRRYPSSGSDLSVITDSRTPVAVIQDALAELGGSDLVLLEFVRQYDGPPLLAGQKSVTYHLEIGASDHTVTTEEVSFVRQRILDGMQARGYEFRV